MVNWGHDVADRRARSCLSDILPLDPVDRHERVYAHRLPHADAHAGNRAAMKRLAALLLAAACGAAGAEPRLLLIPSAGEQVYPSVID